MCCLIEMYVALSLTWLTASVYTASQPLVSNDDIIIAVVGLTLFGSLLCGTSKLSVEAGEQASALCSTFFNFANS